MTGEAFYSHMTLMLNEFDSLTVVFFLFQPAIASSVIRPVVDTKSRTEAAAELTKDSASRDRFVINFNFAMTF